MAPLFYCQDCLHLFEKDSRLIGHDIPQYVLNLSVLLIFHSLLKQAGNLSDQIKG